MKISDKNTICSNHHSKTNLAFSDCCCRNIEAMREGKRKTETEEDGKVCYVI